jgi:hypothetical protein
VVDFKLFCWGKSFQLSCVVEFVIPMWTHSDSVFRRHWNQQSCMCWSAGMGERVRWTWSGSNNWTFGAH